jgi:hypothetical protein
MTTKTTPTPKDPTTKPEPSKGPPPKDAPIGTPGEDDRAQRIAPKGDDAVKVHKGTVTL